MNVTGLIVEYNPFHNGHAYHIQESVSKTKADVVIAVMSGPFLQRGEPAILPKWERAKMAVQAGVDIVVELPFMYAVQSAERFAYGSISLLNALGVDCVAFGSEHGNIDDFLHFRKSEILHKERIDVEVQQYLKAGNSYPRAYHLALRQVIPASDTVDMSQPNNRLGLAYLQAMDAINPMMSAVTFKRRYAHYHDTELYHSSIASATAIRKAMIALDDTWKDYLPRSSVHSVEEALAQGHHFMHWSSLYPVVRSKLLTTPLPVLTTIYGMDEGIEHRLVQAAVQNIHYVDFMQAVKTKRYTWNRIQRLLLYILLHVTKEEAKVYLSNEPSYARLLSVSTNGRKYIKEFKSSFSVPVISSFKQSKDDLLQVDYRASLAYSLGYPISMQHEAAQREYKQVPYIEKS